MLKNILSLEGAQQLTRAEQKSIKGGFTKECIDTLGASGCYLVSTTSCPTDYHSETWAICANHLVCCPD